MKKISLMVVAVLMSAAMFANSASLPKNAKKGNGTPKTEVKKEHKQKDATKKHKEHKAKK
jgi:hypothetical protein